MPRRIQSEASAHILPDVRPAGRFFARPDDRSQPERGRAVFGERLQATAVYSTVSANRAGRSLARSENRIS